MTKIIIEITTEITEIISDVISLGEFGDFGDFGGNFDDIGGVVGDFGDCGSDFGKKIHPRDITAIFAASVSMMFVRLKILLQRVCKSLQSTL